jgi:SAM-dependent methyltransferase
MAKAYNIVAENHRHADGPWTRMRDKVIEAVDGRDGCTILDLASGPGEPAATIAEALPEAQVLATDVAEPMVAAATNATSHLSNVKVQLADAQNLEGMSDASFDVVTCCYGYMFPTEKETALAETLRVLKPGGTLVATTWDILYMMPLARDIMTDIIGKEPPTPDLNPMSLSEDGLFRSLVEGAGFVSVDQTTSTYPFDLGTDRYMQFRCGTLPLKQKFDELDCWTQAESAFWEHVPKYSTEENGALVMPGNTFRLTTARKP